MHAGSFTVVTLRWAAHPDPCPGLAESVPRASRASRVGTISEAYLERKARGKRRGAPMQGRQSRSKNKQPILRQTSRSWLLISMPTRMRRAVMPFMAGSSESSSVARAVPAAAAGPTRTSGARGSRASPHTAREGRTPPPAPMGAATGPPGRTRRPVPLGTPRRGRGCGGQCLHPRDQPLLPLPTWHQVTHGDAKPQQMLQQHPDQRRLLRRGHAQRCCAQPAALPRLQRMQQGSWQAKDLGSLPAAAGRGRPW